ncbi:restriction endonuclease (plasmid) [Kitasatospora purpeofusca]|uniref:restriction endonuclease n=1 Tax=Kitasatospora purpeofusca TaxID=67352 RepID=UPI002E0F63F2|nr:restriction endonuclease [Kitasatospora purpeofusca]
MRLLVSSGLRRQEGGSLLTFEVPGIRLGGSRYCRGRVSGAVTRSKASRTFYASAEAVRDVDIALAAAVAAVRARAAADRRALHTRTAQLRHIGAFMSMSPKAFEHALADLCRRDGCTKVTVVGGAGDLAADVLATTPTGRRILIQAKRYSPRTLVGSQDVQKVNGTYRDIHGCDLAAVVTTSSFTKSAAAFCTQVGIRMTDHRALALWAEGTGRPPGTDPSGPVSEGRLRLGVGRGRKAVAGLQQDGRGRAGRPGQGRVPGRDRPLGREGSGSDGAEGHTAGSSRVP